MPIRSERVSERKVGIDNDGESGCKGLFAGMVIHYTIMPELLIRTKNTALFLTKSIFYGVGIVFVFLNSLFQQYHWGY